MLLCIWWKACLVNFPGTFWTSRWIFVWSLLPVQPPPQKTPSTPHIHAAMGGIGSTVLFQDDSKIGPEPINYGLADDDGTDSYDRFLRQMGEDTAAYVRTVCNTIVLTVPKAIVHCQVGPHTAMISTPWDLMTSLCLHNTSCLHNTR